MFDNIWQQFWHIESMCDLSLRTNTDLILALLLLHARPQSLKECPAQQWLQVHGRQRARLWLGCEGHENGRRLHKKLSPANSVCGCKHVLCLGCCCCCYLCCHLCCYYAAVPLNTDVSFRRKQTLACALLLLLQLFMLNKACFCTFEHITPYLQPPFTYIWAQSPLPAAAAFVHLNTEPLTNSHCFRTTENITLYLQPQLLLPLLCCLLFCGWYLGCLGSPFVCVHIKH